MENNYLVKMPYCVCSVSYRNILKQINKSYPSIAYCTQEFATVIYLPRFLHWKGGVDFFIYISFYTFQNILS